MYIMNESNLTIHNSHFSNNKALGGGVLVSQDEINIVITNSQFINESTGVQNPRHPLQERKISKLSDRYMHTNILTYIHAHIKTSFISDKLFIMV